MGLRTSYRMIRFLGAPFARRNTKYILLIASLWCLLAVSEPNEYSNESMEYRNTAMEYAFKHGHIGENGAERDDAAHDEEVSTRWLGFDWPETSFLGHLGAAAVARLGRWLAVLEPLRGSQCRAGARIAIRSVGEAMALADSFECLFASAPAVTAPLHTLVGHAPTIFATLGDARVRYDGPLDFSGDPHPFKQFAGLRPYLIMDKRSGVLPCEGGPVLAGYMAYKKHILVTYPMYVVEQDSVDIVEVEEEAPTTPGRNVVYFALSQDLNEVCLPVGSGREVTSSSLPGRAGGAEMPPPGDTPPEKAAARTTTTTSHPVFKPGPGPPVDTLADFAVPIGSDMESGRTILLSKAVDMDTGRTIAFYVVLVPPEQIAAPTDILLTKEFSYEPTPASTVLRKLEPTLMRVIENCVSK